MQYCENHPARSHPGRGSYPVAQESEFISKHLCPFESVACKELLRFYYLAVKISAFKNTDFIKHVDRILDFMEKEN